MFNPANPKHACARRFPRRELHAACEPMRCVIKLLLIIVRRRILGYTHTSVGLFFVRSTQIMIYLHVFNALPFICVIIIIRRRFLSQHMSHAIIVIMSAWLIRRGAAITHSRNHSTTRHTTYIHMWFYNHLNRARARLLRMTHTHAHTTDSADDDAQASACTDDCSHRGRNTHLLSALWAGFCLPHDDDDRF